MHVAKKIVLDLALAALLFIPALVVAALVSMRRPDCVTCGSNVGLTFWLIGVGGLQPVLWARGITKRRRLSVWLLAVAVGVGSYVLLESAAGSLLAAGRAEIAIGLGIAANLTGALVGIAASWWLVRRVTPTLKGGAPSAVSLR